MAATPEADAGSQAARITPEEVTEVVSLIDAFDTQGAVARIKEWLEGSLDPEQRLQMESALTAIEKEYDEDKAIEILTSH